MRKETIGPCELYLGDCLEIMPALGKVDAVITDPPYGLTNCAWDKKLEYDALWQCFKPILKPSTPLAMFSQQPFTTDLINSNRKMFRYVWYWQRNQKTGFLNSHKMPMRTVQEILLFYGKLPVYNPQKGTPHKIRHRAESILHLGFAYGKGTIRTVHDFDGSYPTNLLYFPCEFIGNNPYFSKAPRLHPTQKPLALMEYLVKTYTNEGGLVIAPFMGSGTTGVACVNTGRQFIGIEKEPEYFDAACKRIQEAAAQHDKAPGAAG
jgi:site-specific DNA-methyltransferase (adenine-specific)